MRVAVDGKLEIIQSDGAAGCGATERLISWNLYAEWFILWLASIAVKRLPKEKGAMKKERSLIRACYFRTAVMTVVFFLFTAAYFNVYAAETYTPTCPRTATPTVTPTYCGNILKVCPSGACGGYTTLVAAYAAASNPCDIIELWEEQGKIDFYVPLKKRFRHD